MTVTEFLLITLASAIGGVISTIVCWCAVSFRREVSRRRRFKSK